MLEPLQNITIFAPESVLGANGSLIPVAVVPVTDSCERNSTLMSDDYVKLTFTAKERVTIPAFAFIWYDGQLFFNRETYRPQPKGLYQYDVKFVSFANLMNKLDFFRHVVVGGEDGGEWDEPELSMCGTVSDMITIVTDSIHVAATRYGGLFSTLLRTMEVADEFDGGNTLKNYSYDCQRISDVLNDIASQNETEWWFSTKGTPDSGNGVTMVLHFCKCELDDVDMIEVGDESYQTGDPLKPTRTRGLLDVAYSQEWTGVPQRLTVFGSDRNMQRNQAVQNNMYVSYGKRLRLQYNHSCKIGNVTYQHAYAVRDKDGNVIPLRVVNTAGSIEIPGINTGEEVSEKYDEIYPRGYMRVKKVTQRGTDNPIYRVYSVPTVEDGTATDGYRDLTDAEIDALQKNDNTKLFPIVIEGGETLSVSFYTGVLAGREFEVANQSAVMRYDSRDDKYVVDTNMGHWTGVFEIVPDGDNVESPQIPFGNFVPREGDVFALFHMVMPNSYIETASQELAQKAYDIAQEKLATRPEVKCTADPESLEFMNARVSLGLRVSIKSEKFSDDPDARYVSRVTSFSHSLTKPRQMSFKVASSQVMQGSIAAMQAAIADHTNDIQGVAQSARNLSRRGFRDAMEMKDMLETLAAAQMLIGEQKNQFSFTMGIKCVDTITTKYPHGQFDHMEITAGVIQHTQEPYIKDGSDGIYVVAALNSMNRDIHGNSINSVVGGVDYRTMPFYVYAQINTPETGKATIVLVSKDEEEGLAEGSKYADMDDYLLLGILSSEFDDNGASKRIMNRTNGYTQIAGGTITTEQLQDPTRSLIIDMSSNPPRIIAKNGAQIIGHITFLSATDKNGVDISNIGQDVNDAVELAGDAIELAGAEIGGENIFNGDNPVVIGHSRLFYNTVDLGIDIAYDTDYVVSLSRIEAVTPVYVSFHVEKDGTTLEVCKFYYMQNKFEYTFNLAKFENGRLFSGCRLYVIGLGVATDVIKLHDLMVQKGQRATEYQSHIKYLVDSFENAAKAGSTDIEGGLLMTNLIKLKDEQGKVRSGISGLKSDGLFAFAGGTYAEAVANVHGAGKKLPILLTDTGIGSRIGCLTVVSESEVDVESPLGTVKIDTSNGGVRLLNPAGKDKILILPSSIDSKAIAPKAPEMIETWKFSGSGMWVDGGGAQGKNFDYYADDVFGAEYSRINSLGTHVFASGSLNALVSLKGPYASHNIGAQIVVELVADSPTINPIEIGRGSRSMSAGDTSYHDIQVGVSFSNDEIVLLPDVSYRLHVKVGVGTSQTYLGGLTIYDSGGISLKVKQHYAYEPKTIIGLDGFFCATDYANYFKVYTGGQNQQIQAVGLPTSEPQTKGMMWNSNGVIKIKQ